MDGVHHAEHRELLRVGREWKTIVSIRFISNALYKNGGIWTYWVPCWHGSATQHLLNLAIGELCTVAGAGASFSVLVSATPQAVMFRIMAHPIGVGHARPPWAQRVDVIRFQIVLRGYWIRMGDTEKEADSLAAKVLKMKLWDDEAGGRVCMA